jgi:hypothetical protein
MEKQSTKHVKTCARSIKEEKMTLGLGFMAYRRKQRDLSLDYVGCLVTTQIKE